MADLSQYPDRKCETRGCEHPPCTPRMAKPDERIELSDGKRETVIWQCECEWKRATLFKEG